MQTITVKAPMRLPLCGGGSDCPHHWRRSGGFLVTAAIDQYVTVRVGPDFCRPAISDSSAALRYATAAGIEGGIIEVEPDVPPGSGLGGSSSLMVALLRARHPDLPVHELAMAAYHAERYGRLNQPVG
jgi:D-glycero-alpha-D-manno-heptose-7-phosphate kinase